jgi:hypothetical protein
MNLLHITCHKVRDPEADVTPGTSRMNEPVLEVTEAFK